MPNDLNFVVAAIIFVLSVLAIIVLGLFFISITLKIKHRAKKRLARVGEGRISGKVDLDDVRQSLLRKSTDTNLLERISNILARVIPIFNTQRLKRNFRRADLDVTVKSYVVISLVVAIIIALLLAFAEQVSPVDTAIPALIAGMFLVDLYVRMRGNRMSNRFMKQLPDGIDTVIRGIRSGLPVIECIVNVGEEDVQPIGGHFHMVGERVQLGEPIEVALWRVADIIERPEMDFFATSISIQMETGGSLAEALSNLAQLLRQREQMKLKIRAISSEARASAYIIGALPFVMMGILLFTNASYVMPLFTDPRGQIMIGAGLGSISFGALVMWRMTKFEI